MSTVAILQSELVWQQRDANLALISQALSQAPQADLYILPEMFLSGFSMNSAEIAEANGGAQIIEQLTQLAQQYDAAICGSVAVQTAGGYANRLLFVTPQGLLAHYDKVHLFRMADEHQHYRAGQHREVVLWRGVRYLLQICYDLRFPVFFRNRNDYDAAIVVANWPQQRRYAWNTLLAARAIENLSYVLAANRVGSDDNGLNYSGDSQIIDFSGQVLQQLPQAQAGWLTQKLDLDALQQFRKQFPALLDADDFCLY